MSNTGHDKKLASFNCDAKLWEKFTQPCRKNGTTATAVLTAFISHYLDNSLDELAIALGKMLPKEKENGNSKSKRWWRNTWKSIYPKHLSRCF